jgi:hypothetical protein
VHFCFNLIFVKTVPFTFLRGRAITDGQAGRAEQAGGGLAARPPSSPPTSLPSKIKKHQNGFRREKMIRDYIIL